MEIQWQVWRGEQCEYRDDVGEAIAYIHDAINVFGIEQIAMFGQSVLTKEWLFQVLQSAQAEFPQLNLWCTVNRFTRPVLDQLAEANMATWELVEHPHSKDAHILTLHPPKR